MAVGVCAGHSWMDLAPGQDGNRNQFGEQVVAGLQMHSPTSGVPFTPHGAHSMRGSPFDPNPHPADDRGLDSMGPADSGHHHMPCHQGLS